MKVQEQMDAIYGELPLEEIPWSFETPPQQLVEVVENRWVLPCEAVDLGCGAGHQAIWLASQGFRMTGMDLSRRALELARSLAEAMAVACRFTVCDLTGDMSGVDSRFNFAYDWEVLHHVFPRYRELYTRNVHSILRPGAKYMSVCFSEEDAAGYPGEGKYRTTRLGTTLYFSSEKELQQLFEPFFEIEELCTVAVRGKNRPHMAVRALMTRRH